MNIPNKVAPGQPISAKVFNDLLDFIRSTKVTGGPGTRVSRTASGTTIIATAHTKAVSGGAATLTHPFQITDTSDGTDAYIQIRFGTLNDFEPTGEAFGTDINLPSDGTWRVYLKATLNTDGVITGVEMIVDDVAQPADDDTHAYITLGLAVVDGGVVSIINQAATHSLRFCASGRVVESGSVTTRGTYNFWGF